MQSFDLAEATTLAQVLAMDCAARAGLRALVVKGSTMNHHGLRSPQTSSDVDVLLAPSEADAFEATLGRIGWRRRMGEIAGLPVTHHSATFLHDDWPCDIDVHRSFPGFLADPARVFDILWERRETMPAAGQLVTIPDFASSVLILALHAARSNPDDTSRRYEVTELVRLSEGWTDERRADVGRVATATGAAAALPNLLPRLGIDPLVDASVVEPGALAAWNRRAAGSSSGTTTWLRFIVRGPVGDLPRRLRVALLPDADQLRPYGIVREEPRALARARVRWWGMGLRSVRRAVASRLGLRQRNVLADVYEALNREDGALGHEDGA